MIPLYFISFIIIPYCVLSTNLDVLPGNGWNNLDETEQNRIFERTNVTNSFTTINGIIYMLPGCFDSTRTSIDHGEVTSQIVKNVNDISELLYFSLDVELGGTFGELFTVSGSFSSGYRTLKRQIITEEILIVKTFRQVSHFTIKIPPNICQFTESFKKSVENLGNLIQKNNERELRRQSYKLLEAFGTHFVKGITIGGIYGSEASLESSSLNKTTDTDLNIKQAAEFKFDLLAHGKQQFEFNRSTYLRDFHNRDKSTFARTVQGGDSSKNVLDEWIQTVDNNYGVVKRQISPLFELFEKQYLQPSFNDQFWRDYGSKLYDIVKNATLTFYEINAHRGCLDLNSEHFNPYANVDDNKACKAVTDKYYFGGIFTGKCLKIKNILGGGHKCIASYSQHPIFQNVDPEHNLYFCYSDTDSAAKQTQRAYFGGIYTNNYKNPATKDYNCPQGYEVVPLKIDHIDIAFCLSRDNTAPTTSLYKFGGTFSSCDYYNPLANGNGCPSGYQEYPLLNYQSCAISYCMNVVTDDYSYDIIYPSDTVLLRSSMSRDNECDNSGKFLSIKIYYVLSVLIFPVVITFIYY